jgi:putative transposase
MAASGERAEDAPGYHAESVLTAAGLLIELAAELDKTHPGAAASLREGMAETLTILRVSVPSTLARTLRSANDRTHDRNRPGALQVTSVLLRSWRARRRG